MITNNTNTPMSASVSSSTPSSTFSIYDELKKGVVFSLKLDQCVRDTTYNLMHPAPGFRKSDPGLLLGKIQSGKTRAFEGIIAHAFDLGLDIAIVFTKGTTALTQQTIARLENDFSFCIGRVKLGRPEIIVSDILDRRGGFTLRELKCKNIIVCKKETNNMNILLDFVRNKDFSSKKILLIDDEADFASINYITKGGNTELAKIAQQINAVVQQLIDWHYLQVTATPYSLFLQDSGNIVVSNGTISMPIKPRFTNILPIYPEYVGGQQYFVDSKQSDSMYNYLFCPVSDDCRHALVKRDARLIKNIVSSPLLLELRKAMMGYIVASAIRQIQTAKEKDEYYSSSCIVHIEISKAKHLWESELIEALFEAWNQAFIQTGFAIPTTYGIDTLLEEAYKDFCSSINTGIKSGELLASTYTPTLTEVQDQVGEIFRSQDYHIEIVNSNIKIATLLDVNGQLKLSHALNIFIGGQILDRGITIANLLCFFYGRDPKQLQQDTVLQHARMYGRRSKEDMAVTRFYTTQRLYGLLDEINYLDEDLRQWLKEYSMTPNYRKDISVVTTTKSKIVPCSLQKLKMSHCLTLSPHRRIVPSGFQTDSKTTIQPIIDSIKQTLVSQPGYAYIDQNGIFSIDVNVVIDIIKRIRSTYIYRPVYQNVGLDWKEDDMITAISYATTQTNSAAQNGKMWVMYKTGRNMSRVRQNGAFVDAPEDGRTDAPQARAKATDAPILILLLENGKAIDGWRDAEFFWPVLILQKNIQRVIYTI